LTLILKRLNFRFALRLHQFRLYAMLSLS